MISRGECRPFWKGLAFGLIATVAWAFYNVGTSIGRADGFSSADLAMLRYGVAAVVLAPLLIAGRSVGEKVSPARLVFLTLLIGPPFALFINAGYGIAPLAHAVVISPGVTMLVANMLAIVADGKPLPLNRQVGMALLVAGLIAVAADQSSAPVSDLPTWVGDLCFVASGSLWGIFTWLVGRWRLPAVRTTALVSLSAAIVFLPVYLIVIGATDQPLELWLQQAVYQGVLGGAIAIVAFAACVAQLGPGTAALFPALLPPAAVIAAIPMTGQSPTPLQWSGVALASLGLVVSLDVIRRR